MSRWSADPLRIALAPGEIALSRGTRRHAQTTDERDAATLLSALDAILAEDGIWRAARAEVVLSQRLVRHVVTPPPGKALSPDEERALVAASLREVYGELAQDWAIRVHSQPPHAGLVGAATDGAFAQALDALLTRHGFRQTSVRPLASLAARRMPRRVDGWWVLAEPGWLSLFGSADGCWRHVAALPAGNAWHDELPELLARENSLLAAPLPAAAWLHPLGLGQIAAPQDTRLRWQIVPHDARLQCAQALLAV